MNGFDIMKRLLILFFIFVIMIIITNLIKETHCIINNGNILSDGRCYRKCQ